MANERTPQQIIGDDAFNQLTFEGYAVTRPVAQVDGLKTELWATHNKEGVLTGVSALKNPNCSEYVTRSQAEAIIAAKDDLIDKYKWQVRDTCVRAEKAEADNAALTARVKELEGEVFHDQALGITWKQICEQFDKECQHHQQRAKALETQLAAARNALEKLTLHSNSLALAHVHKTHKNDGIWGSLKEARAALEDRP